MAANPVTDFDLGPLTWVKGEIDHSLNQARDNLEKLASQPADRAPVKYILTHLHQATGALAMVGLASATRFNEELEKLVGSLDAADETQVAPAVAVARKGIAGLSTYLDALLAGEQDQPMRLLATYVELNRARGQSDAGEGDLFHPNLAATVPAFTERPEALDEAVRSKALAHQRSQYQQGLLRLLKGDAAEGLRQMHAAVTAIESMQEAAQSRAFWSAASAFFDALVFSGLDLGPAVKPLFARIDQQVKQLIDGVSKVPERLFRDLLLGVARSRAVSERVAILKQVYSLERLISIPDRGARGDDDLLGPLVRELRELTVQQKDTWLKYTSGNRAALEPFGKQAAVLAERSAKLPQAAMRELFEELARVAPALRAKSIPPSEAQSLEVATALLFFESALENYFRPGADFQPQARAVLARVAAAMAGEPLGELGLPEGGLLDEMTRRAQEKLLIFQVGQEVQVNLQNIEQILDAFFRDNSQRSDLARLTAQFAQVQGALMILELGEAAGLNAAVMARVQQFADGSVDGVGEAADIVADGLSALGLFITALQQGVANPGDVLLPALRRFGLAEAPAVETDTEATRTATISPLDIEVQKQKVQALYEDWKEAPAEDTRERLESAVEDLKRDAAVVSDTEVTQQSEAALHFIKEAEGDSTDVFEAIQGLAPENAPAEPEPQVVQLVDAPVAEVDQELLGIFIEEAGEVVETIRSSLDACRDAPHDRDALTTIRRGFHTLKGSGRMVGLVELGEVAWHCEQVMNKWLKEEKPASAALLAFIDLARESFGAWVGELRESGSARIDGEPIRLRADRIKAGQVEVPEAIADAVPAPEAPAPAVEPEVEARIEEPAPAIPAFTFESLDLGEAMPAAELHDAPEAAPAHEASAPEESEIVIGTVSIAPAFFAIYLGEAEQHVEMMEREMAAIEADPLLPVSAAFMRAAHTLRSSSLTTGFETVADLAYALEKWLQDAMEFPPEFDSRRLAVTRMAVDALAAMVQSLRGHAMPYPRDEVVAEVCALREGLKQSAAPAEPGPLPSEPAPAPVVVDAPVATAPVEAPPVIEAAIVEPAPAESEPAPAESEPIVVAEAEAPAAPFEAGKEQRKIKDDLDRDLLPIFLEEAREILPAVSEGVRRWRQTPNDHALAGELVRHLHTLKGSARMTGLMRLGELAHVLETRIMAIDGAESAPASAFDAVEERVDRFSASLERLARGEDILEAEPPEVPVSAVFEQQKDKPGALAVIAAAAQEVANRDAGPPELREVRAALLRVNADMVDRFVNEAGELSIARSRIEGEMATFKRALVDLTENIGRMRAQLREIEIASESQMQSRLKEQEELGTQFDPLEFDRFSRMQELTRFLAESLGDVITLQQSLQKNLDEAELAIHAQARLNRDLQQGLMGVRLVPLANLTDRFYRVVRQTAKELDKKANLELKGTRVELDRSVLEKITGPFEHLLRNAVAHGLETPAARAQAGKPEIGEITIDAVQRGNEVVLTVSDDGAGLDYARIRAKAIEAGLLAPDAEIAEAQLAQFIYVPGFSTAREVSQIAGRGVGMDVVKNEITSLGGRVEIASVRGRGTVFTITLPLTLAVTQAVMLRAGATTYAVPSVMIEQVQEYKAALYAELVAKGEVAWKDNRYPLRSLLPLIGEIDTPTPARQIPVLLLKSGLQRAAIRVDEIIGTREVVVKTIGPQLARLPGIAGATVLGNGQVVLILNPVQLVHRDGDAATPLVAKPLANELVVEEKSGAPLVMVVDDSLTVRKITSRMLTREGYEVATAKDGVDALQQLQDLRPDCILLDVEMPRMDGFEFARNLRADDDTRGIPIIMITSRTADKHRKRALEVGVNEYMGKPYQEEQLLALIKRFTREAAFA